MIRRRLVATIVGVLAVVLLVAGVVVVRTLRERLVSDVDRQLIARVDDLSHRPWRFPGPGPATGSPFVEQRAAFLRLDPSGNVTTAIPSGRYDEPDPLPDVAGRTLSQEPTTVDAVEGGSSYRVVGLRLPDGMLVAAMSLEDVDEAVDNAIAALAIAGVLALVIAAVVVWYIVRRGLRPIDAMIGTAERIAEGDLTERAPVPHPSSEVGHLGTALNTMLDQIETAVAAKTASESRLRRFVADASHELRTPLTSIRGYAELYRQGADDADSVALGMERIERESTRMSALVDDLLLLARLDQGHALKVEPVDVAAVVGDAVDAARVVEPDRHIELSRPDHPVMLDADGDRLRQIVDNLLANVREHTDATTSVTVTVTDDGRHATLVVADDGPGMRDEEATRAFERFWQGEATVEHPRRGTGLGLAIVQDIVTTHGGTVRLETRPGAGVTVTVTLPRSVSVHG